MVIYIGEAFGITNLLTAVTDGGMLVVTSWNAARRHQTFQAELTFMDKREGVSRVVAMGVVEKTHHAEIVVIAVHASDHLSLVKFCQELDHSFNMEASEGELKDEK